MKKIKGIDISNNNGNVDFKSIKNSGVEYIYVKATEGATFKDSYMKAFYDTCRSLSIKVGAYCFLVGTSEPEAQAENFYNMIKDYSWDLIPMLDIETNFSNLCNYIVRFITRFRELSSLELGIYSYTGFLPYLKSIENTIKDMKFWEANYNNNPFVLADSFFSNRVGHQYSDKGIIGNFKGDVDYFTEDILICNSQGKWKIDDKGWWYEFIQGGYPRSQWLKIDGKWYYFNNDGYMSYGWLYTTSDKNWYYLGGKDDGSAKQGWLLQDGKWYYFDKNCVMQKGWVKVNNKWYYMNSDGIMQTGWIKYKGKDYLLYSSGAMACNTIAYGYKFDNSGVAIKL